MSTPPTGEPATPRSVPLVGPVRSWSEPVPSPYGPPQDGSPTGLAGQPTWAPAGPRPRWHRFWFWTAMVLALASLGGGGYLAVATYQHAVAPQTVVGDYLAAVARGDAAAALSFGTLPAPDQFTVDPRSLLTEQVLAAQLDIAPMSAIHVRYVSVDGDIATAHVTYELGFDAGGVMVDDEIPLSREGRSWQLGAPAAKVALALDRASGRASVAGAVVPRGTYYLFPGAMPIAFDTDTLQLTADSRIVTFETAASSKGQNVELSQQGVETFGDAIDAALKICLDGTAAEPTLCPVPGDYRAVPGTLRGTLTTPSAEKLEFKVQPGPQGNILALGELTIDGTYEQLDFNNQRVQKDVEDPVRVTVLSNATDTDEIIWEFL